MLTCPDPYFLPAYAKVNEAVEGGAAETFRYAGPDGTVEHTFIVRPLDDPAGVGVLCDLVTPYGYGGPLLRPEPGVDPQSLVSSFDASFAEFCRDRGVVSEFVRFHPFETEAQRWGGVYAVERLRTTVVTDLTGTDPIRREFSSGALKKIRRNARSGVQIRVTETPGSLEEFRRIYAQTMDRNDASDFYYFGAAYFDGLIDLMRDELVAFEPSYQGAVIGAALCLVGAGRIHIHLSGTDSNFLSLSPAYSLRHAIAEWGVQKGMRVIHHGGGRTDSPEDSLYRYKRQFGSASADFCVGRRVWDAAAYDRLCLAAGVTPADGGFFPAYRHRG